MIALSGRIVSNNYHHERDSLALLTHSLTQHSTNLVNHGILTTAHQERILLKRRRLRVGDGVDRLEQIQDGLLEQERQWRPMRSRARVEIRHNVAVLVVVRAKVLDPAVVLHHGAIDHARSRLHHQRRVHQVLRSASGRLIMASLATTLPGRGASWSPRAHSGELSCSPTRFARFSTTATKAIRHNRVSE